MTLTENLDTFLQDMGLPVIWGSVSGLGLLDMPDDVIAGGLAITTDYSLTVRTDLFGGLVRGNALTVGGIAYTVKELRRIGDGALARVLLSKT